MNETDTSNNGAVMESLNSGNSPKLELASCPFYSVVPNENMAITKLPLLKPAKDTHYEIEVLQLHEDPTQQDWVAEPECDKQVQVDSEFQQLLTLNEELRADNNDLYKQVEQLKDELAESQKVLQWQKTRSSVSESMLNQQTQELAAAQEQIKSLFQQLETAVQTVQHQEIFIETYKAQLQISQQRLAQLERECSLLQTNYSEQSQQLLQSETTCRELRTRLMRQQRQTLQFKAALEKCLDTSVPSYDSLDDTAQHPKDITTGQSRFSRKARSLFPNVEPIKPWSAESEFLTENLDHLWGESSAASSYPRNQSASTHPSSPWNWSIKEDTPIPAQPDYSPKIDDTPNTPEPEVIANSGSSNLDEQLDSLIQMFFSSQTTSGIAPPPAKTNTDSNQNNPPIWNTLATILEDDQEAETASKQQLPEAVPGEINPVVTNSTSWRIDSPMSTSDNLPSFANSPDIETTNEETEDYWSEISRLTQLEFSATDLSRESLGDKTNDSSSPSPVVYPQRPPKGRKSLASVELPNFGQKSQ